MKSPPTLKIVGEMPRLCIAIAVDVDAPYVSVPLLSPIVHWIQPGLKPNDAGVLQFETPCVVDWLAPTPPPFSGPHRYVVILYQQAGDFDVSKWNSKFVKPVSILSRIRWNIDEFAKQAELHKAIAANYFCN